MSEIGLIQSMYQTLIFYNRELIYPFVLHNYEFYQVLFLCNFPRIIKIINVPWVRACVKREGEGKGLFPCLQKKFIFSIKILIFGGYRILIFFLYGENEPCNFVYYLNSVSYGQLINVWFAFDYIYRDM